MALALLLAAASLLTAGSLGRLAVQVVDADGQPIAGARVLLHIPANGRRYEAVTKVDGEVLFAALTGAEELIVRVELPGHVTEERNAVAAAGATRRLTVAMTPLPLPVDRAGEADAAAQPCGRGAALLRERRHDEAREAIDACLTENPDQAAGYVLRGRLHSRAGNHAAAARDFLRALELDGTLRAYTRDSIDGLFDLAIRQIAAGNDHQAMTYMELVLRQAPQHPEALFQRGLIRLRVGDPAAAAADLRHYLKLAPEGEHARTARGLLEAVGG